MRIDLPRLVAGGRGDGVAVHRVAAPHHFAAFARDGADQRRQLGLDLVGAHARDQRQPARLVFGVENVDEAQQVAGIERRTAFEADRVLDAAQELDMRAVGLARAVADPQHVRRAVVPIAAGGIDARQRLLVRQQQRLVRGVEIGLADLRRGLRGQAARRHEIQRLRQAIGHLLIARARRGSSRRSPGSSYGRGAGRRSRLGRRRAAG